MEKDSKCTPMLKCVVKGMIFANEVSQCLIDATTDISPTSIPDLVELVEFRWRNTALTLTL